MVVYNAASRELTAKIVYYGPGLSGKTTNLQILHRRLEPASVGNLLQLAATEDRTIYFDLMPVELGDLKGYRIRFQVATVPGQGPHNETRKLVLRGVDGVVFVVDSRWAMLPKNLESFQNLKENLQAEAIPWEQLPLVIQFNKRDLPDALAVDALQEGLGLGSLPFVEAVASEGKGVVETFKLVSKLTFVELVRRLQKKEVPRSTGTTTAINTWKDTVLRGATRTEPAPSGKPEPLPAKPLSSMLESPFDSPPFENTQPVRQKPSPPSAPFVGDTNLFETDREATNPGLAPSLPENTATDAKDFSTGAFRIPTIEPAPAASSPGTNMLILQRLDEISESLGSLQTRVAAVEKNLASPAAAPSGISRLPDGYRQEIEERLTAFDTRIREINRKLDDTLREQSQQAAQFVESFSLHRGEIESHHQEFTDFAGQVRPELSARKSALEDISQKLRAAELRFGQIAVELESRLDQTSNRWAQIEGDHVALRRQAAEAESNLRRTREDSEQRGRDLETVREQLASSLSDLADRLRQTIETVTRP